jgi:hypothetical protein
MMPEQSRPSIETCIRPFRQSLIDVLEANKAVAYEIEDNVESLLVSKYKVPAPNIEVDLLVKAHVLGIEAAKQVHDVDAAEGRLMPVKTMKLDRLRVLSKELKELDERFWKMAIELELEFDKVLVEPVGGRAKVTAEREEFNRKRLKGARPMRFCFDEMRISRIV